MSSEQSPSPSGSASPSGSTTSTPATSRWTLGAHQGSTSRPTSRSTPNSTAPRACGVGVGTAWPSERGARSR